MKVLNGIDKINEWAGKLFSYAFLAATIVVVYSVVMRYFLNRPTSWGLELTIYLCGVTYLMGGPYAELANAHIRIDSLYNRFSPRGRLLIDLCLTAPLLFFFCVVLIWFSWEWAWQALVTGERSMTEWNPIIWPMRVLIPVSTFLLLLQAIARFIRNLQQLQNS